MPALAPSFRDAVDTDRREILQTLIAMVREGRSGTCWDSEQAGRLLRSQSSVEEVKSLGVEAELIDAVWGDERER
jgi:hypothetical protein